MVGSRAGALPGAVFVSFAARGYLGSCWSERLQPPALRQMPP